SSRRRHTRFSRDWSSDVCSSDLTPVMAQLLSRPLDPRRSAPLPLAIERELRGTARLTWTFFETFVTAEHHYLPPDNYQEDPAPEIGTASCRERAVQRAETRQPPM